MFCDSIVLNTPTALARDRINQMAKDEEDASSALSFGSLLDHGLKMYRSLSGYTACFQLRVDNTICVARLTLTESR